MSQQSNDKVCTLKSKQEMVVRGEMEGGWLLNWT